MRIRIGGASLRVVALPVIAAGLAVTIIGLEVRRERRVALASGEAIVTGSARLGGAEPRINATDSTEAVVASRLPDEVTSKLDFAACIAALGIQREPWPELTGSIVRAEDGAPVPFAEVVVSSFLGMTIAPGLERADEARDCTGRADARGCFRLRTSVDVLVVVHAPGLAPEAAIVEEARAGNADLLHFKLRPSLLLEGRVVDASGAPVVAADVRAVGIEKTGAFRFWGGFCGNPLVDWRPRFGQTDDDGRFGPVECYAGGRALFEVIAEGDSWFLPPIALDVAPAGTRAVELRLPRHARIEGTVRSADGSPASRLIVRVERRFECLSEVDVDTMTADDGTYSRTLSDPGSYRVTVESEADDGTALARRDVQLEAGVNELDFTVRMPAPAPRTVDAARDEDAPADDPPPAGSVGGRLVLGATCDEEARGSVHLMRDGREALAADVGPTGAFEFEEVPPGVYTVTALCAGWVRFVSGPFVVASATRLALPDWTLDPSSSLTGRVVDASGRPVEGASVSLELDLPRTRERDLFSPGPVEVESVHSDPSGGFTLRHVGAPALIVVEREGALPTVRLIPGKAPREKIVIEVASTRRAIGRIEVPGGLPSATFKVFCRVVVPPGVRAVLGDSFGPTAMLCETRVAADGAFEFPAFPTEPCDLEVWVNTSGWDTIGCIVARRRVAAGFADVDLGAWILPAEGR